MKPTTLYVFPKHIRPWEVEEATRLVERALKDDFSINRILEQKTLKDYTPEFKESLARLKRGMAKLRQENAYREDEVFETTDSQYVQGLRRDAARAVYNVNNFIAELRTILNKELFQFKFDAAFYEEPLKVPKNVYGDDVSDLGQINSAIALANVKGMMQYYQSIAESSLVKLLDQVANDLVILQPTVVLGNQKFTPEDADKFEWLDVTEI